MKKLNKSKLAVIIITILVLTMIPLSNFAHSGRTDSNGGHKDNNNKSGLGSYHYHCGGYPAHLHTGGVCPYSSAATTSVQSTSTSTQSTSTKTTPAEVKASKIEIDIADLQILIGETKVLTATISPSNVTDKSVTWKSSDEKIVIIDSEGEISALGIGEATITAKTSNGKEANVKVTVKPIKVSEIKVSESEINLKVNESATLTATILPENATDKTIEWISENPEIATVEDGIITALAVGTTKVICQSKDEIKSEVNVIVEEQKIVENENTVEVSATVNENSNEDSDTTSDSNAVLGAIALGAMAGVPVYLHRKKKK